jgi:hypothetical protein
VSHVIPAPTCIRTGRRVSGATRLSHAATTADRLAADIEAEIGRLRLLGEDPGVLPDVAAELGALHGELEELDHGHEAAR